MSASPTTCRVRPARPSGLAGPKVAHFDRVEWSVIPDAATALGAMQTGEQDWWEQPTFDLLPLLRKDAKIKLEALDPSGSPSMMRFNHLFPPFDNPAIRRAMLGAVNQADFMTAVAGTDPSRLARHASASSHPARRWPATSAWTCSKGRATTTR